MKKETTISIFLIMAVIFMPLASAEIILNKQPNQIYNLGDNINMPVKIKASQDISGIFNMDLICQEQNINFYKNGISLNYGEELKLTPSLLLTKSVIGNIKGNCKIKAILGEETALTNEFRISDIIYLNSTNINQEFLPGQEIFINGEATKQSNSIVDGFIKLQIITTHKNKTSNITQLDTINKGYFSINLSLPEKMKAGTHLLRLKAYEKINEQITNHGEKNYEIYVRQVPRNLEIVSENKEIKPDTSIKVKAILRDQTGEKIESEALITIKDSQQTILKQIKKPTDEFLEYPILYNHKPENISVTAVSNELTAQSNFEISELEKIKLELINKTILATNMGNIPYNKTVLVKIGENQLNLDLFVKVNKTEKYILSAPNGEYEIEVLSNGENLLSGNTVLTGSSINVKKASQGIKSLTKYPLAWLFLIIILGFIAFIVFKKGYKKSFIGKFRKTGSKIHDMKNKQRENKEESSKKPKSSLINPNNIAELSLSIKGDKQSISLTTLKIKNLTQIKSKESNSPETLQKIIDLAEENKAYIYQNQEFIFFIFAPIITKTFRNEKTAIEFSEKAIKILNEHNKKFKQKIDFGISINHGEVIAKLNKEILQFMGMKTLIPHSKKVSGQANNEILLTKDFNEKLGSDIKTQKHKENYKIKNIIDREEHKTFISNFLKRQEEHKNK